MVSRWGDAAKALLPPEWSPEWFIAALLAAADPADPLRALLADEDQAVEVMAAAAWNALCETVWADESAQHRAQWVRENRFEYAAILAALREVANGTAR